MRLLVCGGAGFIGSNFARLRLRDHGDEVVVLDKLTYAGRRENLQDLATTRLPLRRTARSRTREAVAEAIGRAATRSSTSPPRRTSTARSPSPTRSSRTHALGTYVLLEAARERGAALRPGLHRRGLRLDRGGLVHRGLAAGALLALLARRKAGADLLVSSLLPHLRARDADLPRLEQLRALPVPREADPADGAQRPARRSRCRSTATGCRCATGSTSRTSRRAIGHVLEHGEPGEVYNVGGPDECPNLEVVQRILELTGPRRVADRVRHRPTRPRPPLLAVAPTRSARSAGRPQVRFDDGLGRTVAWYRDNAGGGSRSAAATTARTTSASTDAR